MNIIGERDLELIIDLTLQINKLLKKFFLDLKLNLVDFNHLDTIRKNK